MKDPKVIVVTGASAGVGRATVREFARKKTKIALLARDRARLEAVKKEVEEAGSEALILPTDVACYEQVFDAAAVTEEKLGPIDIWVNNAMTTVFAAFKDITPDEYRRATEVTYLGTVYGTMAAMKYMLPRDRGTIIQVGSALAYRSIPLQAPYCAAKSAIRGFTDSIRSELIHDKSHVHITMVHLPALNTPQFDWCKSKLPNHPMPVPPIFEPEVAARAIVWSASHRRRELLVGRSTLKAVVGTKIVPGLLDRMLARKAYSGQQSGQPVPRDRPFNLFHPVQGDYAAHGAFDDDAAKKSWHLRINTKSLRFRVTAVLAVLLPLLVWQQAF